MEFEFDERALYDCKDSYYNRMKAYMDYFEKNDVFKNSAIAYYSGGDAILKMYQSHNIKDQEIMDRFANLLIERHDRKLK